MLAAFRWEVRKALTLCAEAEQMLFPDDHFSWAVLHQAAGNAYLMAARYDEAVAQFQQAAERAQQMGGNYIARFPALRMAQIQLRQGRLHTAAQSYRRFLQQAHDRGGAHWPILADGLIGMADVLREQNDLLAAEHFVRRGLAIAPTRSVEIWAWGRAVQARISLALGRRDGSALELDEAVRQALQYNNEHLVGLLRAHKARLDLATGDLEAARQWAQGYTGTWNEGGYLPVFEELTLARFHLADRRPRAALALLDSWQARAEAAGQTRGLIEIGLLRALALNALGQRTEVQNNLRRALALAEPENLRRVFLDEGDCMASLLEPLAASSEFAASLYATLRDGSAPGRTVSSLAEPLDKLTPREMEILRALARGASNQEVADTYVLTVGTVKGHVNHILSKLGARNRTEAVARGRELGLL
jgi:LuxR family maltose regulon positive regulatory protein